MFCLAAADEGDFVNLQSKHNFTMAHFGLLLGVLRNNLQELQIQHCNDIFCRTHQVSCPALPLHSPITPYMA